MSAFYTAAQSAFRLSASNSAYVTQMAASGKSRQLPSTIALAMAACAISDLPGGNVESPETYFVENAGVAAAEVIGIINEIVPVDYRSALKIAQQLFLIRYEISVKPFSAFGVDRCDGVASIFGLNAHLSKDVLEAICCNGQEITDKYDRFMQIIADLKKD